MLHHFIQAVLWEETHSWTIHPLSWHREWLGTSRARHENWSSLKTHRMFSHWRRVLDAPYTQGQRLILQKPPPEFIEGLNEAFRLDLVGWYWEMAPSNVWPMELLFSHTNITVQLTTLNPPVVWWLLDFQHLNTEQATAFLRTSSLFKPKARILSKSVSERKTTLVSWVPYSSVAIQFENRGFNRGPELPRSLSAPLISVRDYLFLLPLNSLLIKRLCRTRIRAGTLQKP